MKAVWLTDYKTMECLNAHQITVVDENKTILAHAHLQTVKNDYRDGDESIAWDELADGIDVFDIFAEHASYDNQMLHIHEFIVEPEARGKGVGSFMMGEIKKKFPLSHYSIMANVVPLTYPKGKKRKGRIEMLNFFSKHNFVRLFVPNYVVTEGDGLYTKKRVDYHLYE